MTRYKGHVRQKTRFAIPLLAAAVLAGASTGCSTTEPSATASAPGRVDVAQFAELIATPGVQIVDVRTPEEFADGHIAGALNIPVQQPDFAERVAQLDPTKTYAVYCRSSRRSQPAVAQMNAAGITNVYELTGGTVAWADAGQPLTR